MEATEQFLQWVEESGNIVFFGGAGVSTESGIPDFRSVDGLYNQQYKYPPETILSHSFTGRIRKSSTGFTGTKCSVWMHSQILPISSWQSWKSRKTERGRDPEYRWSASESRK